MAGRSTVLSRFPDSGEWSRFFEEAGLPSVVSAEYGLIFESNRIRSDYLNELNEKYLEIMGIEKVGDIIAILRHSKNVLRKLACETVSEEKTVVLKTQDKGVVKSKSCGPTVSSARVSRRDDSDEEVVKETSPPIREEVPVSKSETSLKRKQLKKGESNSELTASVPSTLSSTVTTVSRFAKKTRRVVPPPVESEKYVQQLSSTSSYSGKGDTTVKKTCVLSRLGEKPSTSTSTPSSSSAVDSQPAFVVTDNFGLVKKQKIMKTNETVFDRLGMKSITNSTDSSMGDSFDNSDVRNSVMFENEDGNVDMAVKIYEEEEEEEEDDDDEEESPQNTRVVLQQRINLQERLMLKNKKIAALPMKTKQSLPYMGILKTSKQKEKASLIKKKKFTTMRADEEQHHVGLHLKKGIKKPTMKKQPVKSSAPVSQSTEGILANVPRAFKNNVKERLGKTNIVRSVNKNREMITKKVVMSKPTQVRAIGSTTTSIRNERKKIVFDLKDDDDDVARGNRMIQKTTFLNLSRVTPAQTSSTVVKRVTFSEPVSNNNFNATKKLFFTSSNSNNNNNNNSRNRYVPPPTTVRNCVFDRLG